MAPTRALELRRQDHPYAHQGSRFLFQKPLVATPAAVDAFGNGVVYACFLLLLKEARQHGGLDYAQVFDDVANPEGPPLWFIEDEEVVTALLPSDY